MKELIYRRAASGYKIDRCAEGISAANRTTGSAHATSCMKEVEEAYVAANRLQEPEKTARMKMVMDAVTYRQFRLDDGTVALGVGYMDPHGSRNSLMGHMLYAAGEEIARLLNSYPSQSSYFSRFRGEYQQNEQLHSAPEEMEIPVENYLSGSRGGLASALDFLKKIFQTPENLAGVFEALLDAASDNAKMVVLFGPEEAHDVMAERGRAIIEALFACLPNVLTRHLGYISPAHTDAGNAIFGVRYSKVRNIDGKLRNYAYSYNLMEQKLTLPPKPDHAAAEYAAELAQLVFAGNEAAVKRIGALKNLLDDEELYHHTDVPGKLALRYRFYNNAAALSAQDKKELLDWHHGVIDGAEKKKDASLPDRSKFWAEVDRWILGYAAGDIYANSGAWKDTDPVYSQRRIAEIYNDGQKLFAMQRKEAQAYLNYFANRIGVQPLLDPASEQRVTADLVKYVRDQLNKAQDTRFAERILYWNPIQRWFNKCWCGGMLLNDRNSFDAVKRMYDLDPELAAGYIGAYADHVRRSEAKLLDLVRTNFGRAVYQTILNDTPNYVADSMRRELDKLNLFGVPTDSEVVAKFVHYRRLIDGNEALVQCFHSICDSRLSYTMRQAQPEHLPQLFAELEADEENPCMINTCKQLNPARDARSIIENRIVELTRADGVYPLYPGKVKLARDVAALLDRKGGQGVWAQRLRVLDKAHTLLLNDLTDEEFDRLMEFGFGAGNDRVLADRVVQLLWQNIERTFKEDDADLKKLVMALALRSGGGGFSPSAIVKEIERFDVAPKKLFAFCKKTAKGAGERGIGYVAAKVLELAGEDNLRRDDWAPYPGRAYEGENSYYDDEEAPKASSGMFAGIPMAVAAAMVVVFGGGLAASVIGVLNCIGLM